MLQPKKSKFTEKLPFVLKKESRVVEKESTKTVFNSNKGILNDLKQGKHNNFKHEQTNYDLDNGYPVPVNLRSHGDYYRKYMSDLNAKNDSLRKNDVINFSKEPGLKLTRGRLNLSNIDPVVPRELINAAKRQNIDPMLMLALGARESNMVGSIRSNSQNGYDGLKKQRSKDEVVSGWNVAEKYLPTNPDMFFADKKIPGVSTEKYSFGIAANITDLNAVNNYIKKHPELEKQYLEKTKLVKNIKSLNSYDLAAKMIKEKGLKNYNPGDSDYSNKVMKDYRLLESDPNMIDFLKKNRAVKPLKK